jgi:O-antigen/teichoic acid export membrane protein
MEVTVSRIASQISRFMQTARYVRLKPFDVSTPQGRSAERHRRLALSALAFMSGKALQVAITLISVPLTLHYLGPERYGLWMTITSVIAMLAFTDLGLGNGAMNAIAEAEGRDDRALAARVVTSGVMMLTMVALILGIIFAASYPFASWPRLFNVTSDIAMREVGPAVAAFVGCFLLGLPFNLVSRILSGYQEGFATAMWTGLGTLLSLVALLIVIKVQAGLVWLVLAMSGTPVLVWAVCSIYVYFIQRPWLRPRIMHFSIATARQLLRVGSLFFILQIAVTLGFFSANMVTTQVLGAARVAEYNIPQRLFGLSYMMLTMLMGGLWPAYREAHARGDIEWIKRTLRRSMMTTIALIVPASLVLLVFHRPIIHLWIGRSADSMMPSLWLVAGFAIWNVLSTCGMTLSMFLNGLHIVRFQMWTSIPMAVSNLLLSIVLAKVWGLPGVIWGAVIAYVIFTVIPSVIYVPRILHNLKPAPAPASNEPMEPLSVPAGDLS